MPYSIRTKLDPRIVVKHGSSIDLAIFFLPSTDASSLAFRSSFLLAEQMKIAPNQRCYEVAVKACGEGGHWEGAISLLREMQTAGFMPEEGCYASAVKACEKGGQEEQARMLAEEMAALKNSTAPSGVPAIVSQNAEESMTGEAFLP